MNACDTDLGWLADIAAISLAMLSRDPSRGYVLGVEREGAAKPLWYFERTAIRASKAAGIYFHRWLQSDGRDMHDHYYDSVSIILTGGYWEITPEGRFWRAPGDVIFRRAEEPHRIEIDPDKPFPESLFIVGPARREMGFYTEKGWVPIDQYMADLRKARAEEARAAA